MSSCDAYCTENQDRMCGRVALTALIDFRDSRLDKFKHYSIRRQTAMSDDATALERHRRAQHAFAGVLANVKSDQLDDPTPCPDWTVRDLLGHVIGGNQR